MMTTAEQKPIRLAEMVASLSLATDLGMGQPMEQALRTCLLSMRAARALAVTSPDLTATYYLALLRFVGCTADAHEAALAAGGDEIADRAAIAPVVMADMRAYLGYLLRDLAKDSPLPTRLKLIARALGEGKEGANRQMAAHCEVAQMLAQRMGLPGPVGVNVGATFERWDGKGIPGDLAADTIPVPARIVSVARDVDIFYRLGGWPLASKVLLKRRGHAYSPDVAGAFIDQGAAWLQELDALPAWEAVLEAEPEPHMHVGETELDAILGAFADFVDIKSPFTLGHSTEVAGLASKAAQHASLHGDEVRDLCRAALVHDLGKAGIPNGIWDKPGSLSMSERERVRLHPYLTERILAPSAPLQRIALIAGSHHERLDGSGYHRGIQGEALTRASRLLAAADVFQAMGQDRPYRPALAPDARVAALQHEAEAGRLDRDAVRCVLAAAGEHVSPRRASWPHGLTDREVEVLRLISRGASNREVAGHLVISPKTAGRHIENIYAKINVSSRASAALFALQNGLLRD